MKSHCLLNGPLSGRLDRPFQVFQPEFLAVVIGPDDQSIRIEEKRIRPDRIVSGRLLRIFGEKASSVHIRIVNHPCLLATRLAQHCHAT